MTGDEKVALLLGSLPPQTVEPILARLTPAEAERVRMRLQEPPPAGAALADVAREFHDIARITAHQVPPSEPPPVNATTTPEDPIAALTQFPPEILAAALRTERPATVALVLGFLEVPQASAVLKQLPPEVRLEAVARQMQPAPLKPELVQRVLQLLLSRCRQLADAPARASADDQILRMADLIRSLGREDRREVTARLEKADPATADKVRKLLYRMSDLLRVDDRTVQSLLGNLDVKTLALALKAADEDIRAKVLNNVSRRARDNVMEEMELLANPQPAQIEEAQGQILDFLRKLDEEGNLTL